MSRRILVVEDNRDLAGLLGLHLGDLSYEVDLAFDGDTGFEKLNAKDYDLIILDIVMPGMGGSEVFQELRKLEPKVKVLLCSGYSIQGEADRLIGIGASSFIQKPFSLRSLEQSINDILGPESR